MHIVQTVPDMAMIMWFLSQLKQFYWGDLMD